MFCPYPWPYGVKDFYGSRNIQIGWKYYQGVIHNTYYGGHIETDHHIICLILEYVIKHFTLHNFDTPVPGMLRGVLGNDTKTRDKISLNGLGMKKVKSRGTYVITKK